jgi:CRP-like cAMP-binding protein
MVSRSTDELGKFLASPLLAGVDDDARVAVFRRLVPGRARAGTALLSEGKPNEKLLFVIEGSVAIERKQPDGHVNVMATMSGPAIFGTTTFFHPIPSSASIRASTDLTLWTLDREGHEALRREDPRSAEALASALLRVLAERFDVLAARLAGLMAEHDDDHPRSNEWANFRARLFEDPAL